MGSNPILGKSLTFSKDVEDVIEELIDELKVNDFEQKFKVPMRLLAIKRCV